MKKWIGFFVALSLVLAFSLPVYAQKAKPMPMSTEEADKEMKECMKMIEASMGKMKEMHEKMLKGEMKMDPAKMKKLKKDATAVWEDLDKLRHLGP